MNDQKWNLIVSHRLAFSVTSAALNEVWVGILPIEIIGYLTKMLTQNPDFHFRILIQRLTYFTLASVP